MGKRIKLIILNSTEEFVVVDGDIDGPNPPMGSELKCITHKLAGCAGVTRKECYVMENHNGNSTIVKESDVQLVYTENVEDDKVPTS